MQQYEEEHKTKYVSVGEYYTYAQYNSFNRYVDDLEKEIESKEIEVYYAEMMQCLTVNELLKEKEETASQAIKLYNTVMHRLKKSKDEVEAKANFRSKELNSLLTKYEGIS